MKFIEVTTREGAFLLRLDSIIRIEESPFLCCRGTTIIYIELPAKKKWKRRIEYLYVKESIETLKDKLAAVGAI